ncbi:MAG: 4Fe-4S dicluster domain-containing protein [Thermodesulfobacteriota bacterium]
MPYFKVNTRCNGCLACVQNCPADALDFQDRKNRRTLLHNMTRCARCGNCWRICPQQAIEFQYLMMGPWDKIVTLDLIRCRVCGRIIDPVPYGKAVADKLGTGQQPLCPQHRESIDFLARAYDPFRSSNEKEV